MTYVGITPAGELIALPAPVSVRLNQTEDAPADGFTGVFPLRKSCGNLTKLRIYGSNHDLYFDGIVDEQKESCGNEIRLMLSARSRAALLLDNEAVPQTYCMPLLETIFTRHVKPYGFSGLTGNTKTVSGELAVTKGMSEWETVQKFCTDFLKTTPHIVNGALVASGERPQGNILFDQNGGVQYSSAAVQNNYCRLYSELFVQSSASGTYSAAVQDSGAQALGVKRRRFLSAGTNADALIKTTRRKAFAVTVICPGEVAAKLRMSASIRDEFLGAIQNLYVSEIDYTIGLDGEITRFTLRRRE